MQNQWNLELCPHDPATPPDASGRLRTSPPAFVALPARLRAGGGVRGVILGLFKRGESGPGGPVGARRLGGNRLGSEGFPVGLVEPGRHDRGADDDADDKADNNADDSVAHHVPLGIPAYSRRPVFKRTPRVISAEASVKGLVGAL